MNTYFHLAEENEVKMNEPKIESGLQLFARVNETQHNNIMKFLPLFPNGIYPKESIEVIGECGVGKTFLLLDFVINAILPKTYSNIQLPGNDTEVILINTDHQFNIGHVANFMEYKLKQLLKKSPTMNTIEECLKKITLLNCYDSKQLKFTFLNLEYMLQENKKIRLVAVDSICSYYWMDRMDLGCVSFNNYCSTVRDALVGVINDFNINVIYTKVKIPTQTEGYMNKGDYCIYLQKDNGGNYLVDVTKHENILIQMRYTLKPFINFLFK